VTTPPLRTAIHGCLGNTGYLHCRRGQRDLATHKIGRIRPAGVRPPCTRDLGRLFLGSVSGPDSNTHGCGVRDMVRRWHSADLRRWLVILSATSHHDAGPVHRVGRCGCNRLEPINQSGLVRDWRWASVGKECSTCDGVGKAVQCLFLALTDEQPSMDGTAAIGGAADIGGLWAGGQDSRNLTRCGLWPAREPTAATSIQNDSGLPQGPADLPLAGSTCGKPAAHRGPLAGMIDGGTAWEGRSCVWPETA
jgi:hypothetical protein